jgi:hypothetical protein
VRVPSLNTELLKETASASFPLSSHKPKILQPTLEEVAVLLERNRRATTTLSPILYLFQIPTSTLYRKLQIVLSQEDQIPLVIETQRRPGPKDIYYGISEDQWPAVLQRVLENHESYRKIAADYGVSRETIRRLVQASHMTG